MKYDYDVIVIGGGAAGLTASGMSVNFGAKTLLIEANKMGGDCTWHGCIPSKTLLHAAKIAHQLRRGAEFGISSREIELDGKSVFEHIRKIRQSVYVEADQPSIYQNMGMDVEFGMAKFIDSHTIELRDSTPHYITSRYFVIATGSKAVIPSIDGLSEVPYLTNESLFELEDLPEKLTIVGAGPVGIEMGQAFQRLGVKVTVIDLLPVILSKDDSEFSEGLKSTLEKEGITFYLNSRIKSVEKKGDDITVHLSVAGAEHTVESDAILLATGRKANISSLQPEVAGINCNQLGIQVDDHCRTNIRNIFACGDVTGRYQLTHMSEHMAKVAVTNALLKVPLKIDRKNVPRCTYTDPEIAHVGATQKSLEANNISYHLYRFPFNKIDRAITDDETTGMIKVFAKKWNGKILGATIMGVHAGDLIGEFALAMKNGITLRNMADTIYPYPTYALGNRRAADQWYVQRQSVLMVKILKRLFGYRGPLPDLSDPDRIV